MKFEGNPLVNKPATGKHILCNKAAAAPMAMSRLISISTEPILMRFSVNCRKLCQDQHGLVKFSLMRRNFVPEACI